MARGVVHRQLPTSGSAVPAQPTRRESQEQIQIIAIAIGKPRTKAPATAKVNSVSKFTSGRNRSTDMLFLPRAEGKSRHRDDAVTAFGPCARFQKVQWKVRWNG
jgi:hypothetical protein